MVAIERSDDVVAMLVVSGALGLLGPVLFRYADGIDESVARQNEGDE